MLRAEHGGTEPSQRRTYSSSCHGGQWRGCCSATDTQVDLANALTVLQFRGLKLPKGDVSPERWTEQRRIGTAAMHAMIAIASSISDVGGPSHPKLSFYDDA